MKEATLAFYLEKINTVKQYIADHYDRASITEIAAEFHFSKYHLSHTFKTITGFPIAKYINMIRLQKSFDEIVYTKKSLVEISLNCGFNNYETLTRAFSKKYKVAPDDLRNILCLLQHEGKVPAIGFQLICMQDTEIDRLIDLTKTSKRRVFTAERNAKPSTKKSKYLVNSYSI